MKLRLQLSVVVCALLGGLALLGCKAETEIDATTSAEPATEPATEAAATPTDEAVPAEANPAESEPAAEVETEATPVDRAAEAATLPQVSGGEGAGGTLLSPRDGVKILMPDGYDQSEADDGSLLRLVRREPVGGVKVTLTLDYSVDDKLQPETTLASLKDKFVKTFSDTLVDLHYQTVQTKSVSIAGYPALELVGDLSAQDQNYRAKKLVILQDKTFWYLGVIGPRDEFDQTVAPEFQAIAASLELP